MIGLYHSIPFIESVIFDYLDRNSSQFAFDVTILYMSKLMPESVSDANFFIHYDSYCMQHRTDLEASSLKNYISNLGLIFGAI